MMSGKMDTELPRRPARQQLLPGPARRLGPGSAATGVPRALPPVLAGTALGSGTDQGRSAADSGPRGPLGRQPHHQPGAGARGRAAVAPHRLLDRDRSLVGADDLADD